MPDISFKIEQGQLSIFTRSPQGILWRSMNAFKTPLLRFLPELALLLLTLIGQNVLAQNTNKSPTAIYKVTEFKIHLDTKLKDHFGQDLILSSGDFQLGPENIIDLDILSPFERRGGDGEPPRGPVFLRLKNENNGVRKILELNFSGERGVSFWVHRDHRYTGQNLGIDFIEDKDGESATLVLVKDQSINQPSEVARIRAMKTKTH